MKWLAGTKVLRLSSLKLPGDFAARKKAAHVKEDRASSIKEVGLINLPVVVFDEKPRRVVAGVDRLAALVVNGLKPHDGVEVRAVVEATPEELERLEIHENLGRRHDNKDELKRRLEGIEEAKFRADAVQGVAEADGAPPPAPPKKAAVREKVARALGTTPAAVKQAAYRDRKRKGEVKPQATKAAIDTMGLEVPEVVLAAAATVKDALQKADTYLRQALAALKPLEGGKLLNAEIWKRMRESIDVAGQAVRERMPLAACPRCKRDGGMCSGCLGYGWVAVGARTWMEELRAPKKEEDLAF